MCSKKAKRLQAEIEALHSQLLKEEDAMAKLELEKRYHATIPSICSQLMARQVQLTELTTRRLICLTGWLVALTLTLVGLTVALLLFTIALRKQASA